MTTTAAPDDVMSGVQSREADIENVDAGNGTLLVRAVPYEHEAELFPGFFESFARGAFSRAAKDPQRVKLRLEHGGPIVGVATTIEDRFDGVWIDYRFANTLAGQEARELARDKILDQVSITFRPMKDWWKVTRDGAGDHLRHLRAHLLDTSLVAHGAYADKAFIEAARELAAERDAELAQYRAQADAERRARMAALAKLNH